MISEPEMAGEFGAVETREVMGDFDREFVGERRPRKPWLWALGGVVMASALWAGALFLYGLGDRKPDMHGYQLDQDPCPSLQLKSIGAAIAPRQSTTKVESGLLNHAALDQIQCFIPLRPQARAERPGNGWSLDYAVAITVALHKKTDPGAEFEARQRVTEFGVDPEAKLETVPDLGEKAYLLTRDDGNSELRVLEGGAVLSLSLSAFTQYQSDDHSEAVAGDGPDIPDLSPYQSAMISDMRDLMSSLKQ
jgi:hypothetical protein